ncbi:unnamed protein product [Boreogadus saida]
MRSPFCVIVGQQSAGSTRAEVWRLWERSAVDQRGSWPRPQAVLALKTAAASLVPVSTRSLLLIYSKTVLLLHRLNSPSPLMLDVHLSPWVGNISRQ